MISDTLNMIIGKVYKLEYIKSIYRTKIQKFQRNDYVMMPNSDCDFFKFFNSYKDLEEKFFSIYKNIDIYKIDRADSIGNIIELTISDISKDINFSILNSNKIIISGVILTGIETSDPNEPSTRSIIGLSPKIEESDNYLATFQLSTTLGGYNLLYNLSSSNDEVKL